MMKNVTQAKLALFLVFTIANVNRSFAEDPLSTFLHRDKLVVLPVALQNTVSVGSILVVQSQAFRHLSTQVYQPGSLKITGEKPAAQGAVISNSYFSAAGSISLGALNPGAALAVGSKWTVNQVEWVTNNIADEGVIDDYLVTDPVVKKTLDRFRVPVNGTLMGFGSTYRIYIVTGIFGTGKLNIKSSSNIALQLSNNGTAGNCQTAGSDGTTPSTTPSAGSLTTTAGTIYAATTTICVNPNGTYDLSHDPAIPLGIRLNEININSSNQPEAQGVAYQNVHIQ